LITVHKDKHGAVEVVLVVMWSQLVN